MPKRFLLIFLLFVSMLLLQESFAQDSPQWHLPDGVKARIGKGWADDIAVSPDGGQLAVATGIGIWLYNLTTGVEIALLTGHTDRVIAVAYSPNGETLASLSFEEILLWNPQTQAQKKNFDVSNARSLAYSPNGKRLAVGGWRSLQVLNAETGARERSLSGHTSSVELLSFLPDNQTLVSASRDNRDKGIRVWNTDTGQRLRTLSEHNEGISSMTVSPDGNTVVAGTWDDQLHFYNTHRGGKTTLQMWSRSLTYTPDGNRIAVGQTDIRLLNARTRQTQRTLSGHTDGVRRMHFFSNGTTLVSLSYDDTIRVWDITTGSNRLTIDGHFDFRDVALSPNGNTIATAVEKNVYLWNTSNGKFSKAFHVDGEWVNALAYSHNGDTLAVESWKDGHRVLLLNAETGTVTKTLRHQGDAGVRSLTFSPDGGQLAGGSWNGEIRLWNTRTGNLQRTLTGHQEQISSIVFSPNGKLLVTRSWDGETRLWNPKTGKHLRTVSQRHADPRIYAVAFSPDNNVLATGIWDRVQLRNPQNGHIQQTLHQGGEALAYSRNGQTLASSTWQKIHLWNTRTGALKQTLLGTSEAVNYLAFAPNGQTLVSHGWAQNILIWNMNALPTIVAEDVTLDGVVDVEDLLAVAAKFGKSVKAGDYPDPDINNDGVVNRQDVIRVIAVLEAAAAAPVLGAHPTEGLTAESLRYWIDRAKSLNTIDPISQKGLQVLEELFAGLTVQNRKTPHETRLLPNYPNPFNPETWIPYQLAVPADVQITIYDAKGVVVRVLALGHQPIGFYAHRSRAAYWDGRNTLGEPVASGIYFYQLETDTMSALRKMVILK